MDGQTRTAMTVAYAISFLVAVVGNSLIIHIIRKSPAMKTKTNLFLVNMAVADLLIAFSIMPFSVHRYYKTGWFEGPFGEFMCKMTFLLSHVVLAASIITLVVMALERFIAIVYLLKASPLQKIRLVSFIIWFTSVLVMSPIGIAAKVTRTENGTRYCWRTWNIFGDPDLAPKIFYTFSFLVLYILPCILMVVLYSMIAWKLWKRELPGNQSVRSKRIIQRSRRKVIRLLVTIVGVFALCWLPIQVMNLLVAFQSELLKSIPRLVRSLLYFLGHSNSAINPCLCLVLNRKFRRALFGIITTAKLEITGTLRGAVV